MDNLSIKPPLGLIPMGLIPKDIWEYNRLQDVRNAIERYYNTGMKIPIEWVEEYNELVKISDK